MGGSLACSWCSSSTTAATPHTRPHACGWNGALQPVASPHPQSATHLEAFEPARQCNPFDIAVGLAGTAGQTSLPGIFEKSQSPYPHLQRLHLSHPNSALTLPTYIQISKTHTIFLSFETLDAPANTDTFIQCHDKQAPQIAQALAAAIRSAASSPAASPRKFQFPMHPPEKEIGLSPALPSAK